MNCSPLAADGTTEYVVKPYAKEYVFVTEKKVPKVGFVVVFLFHFHL